MDHRNDISIVKEKWIKWIDSTLPLFKIQHPTFKIKTHYVKKSFQTCTYKNG